jgi:hypothetical protein
MEDISPKRENYKETSLDILVPAISAATKMFDYWLEHATMLNFLRRVCRLFNFHNA